MGTILEHLVSSPKSYSELCELTEMPVSTLKRQLRLMYENGSITHNGEKYSIPKPTPSAHEVADHMEIIYQQKNMDKMFRRHNAAKKADLILEWYMDHGIRGKIDDYFQGEKDDKVRNSLLNAIHEGFNLFLQKNKLVWDEVTKNEKF